MPTDESRQPRKHLLILGAGASMSLVPERKGIPQNTHPVEVDANVKCRLPSGSQLVKHIANYKKDVLFIFMVISYNEKYLSQQYKVFLNLRNEINLDQHSLVDSLNDHIKHICFQSGDKDDK